MSVYVHTHPQTLLPPRQLFAEDDAEGVLGRGGVIGDSVAERERDREEEDALLLLPASRRDDQDDVLFHKVSLSLSVSLVLSLPNSLSPPSP